jgi:hypothetical protein
MYPSDHRAVRDYGRALQALIRYSGPPVDVDPPFDRGNLRASTLLLLCAHKQTPVLTTIKQWLMPLTHLKKLTKEALSCMNTSRTQRRPPRQDAI